MNQPLPEAAADHATPVCIFAMGSKANSGAGAGAIITRNGKHIAEPITAYEQGVSQPCMWLRAIALALEKAPLNAESIEVIADANWLCAIANEGLKDIIDTFCGYKANGAHLANPEAWKQVREAARRFGGLACDGGRVRFLRSRSDTERRFLRTATSIAREAAKAAEVAK